MDRKGTHELISGEKPFFCNFVQPPCIFRCSFIRLDARKYSEKDTNMYMCMFIYVYQMFNLL